MSNSTNRFSVARCTVYNPLIPGRLWPISSDIVLTGARILSVYSERMLDDQEIWIAKGRIASVAQVAAHLKKHLAMMLRVVSCPGLVDPHIHIESSMMTYKHAEGALLNGTTTLFCDSHEIGNVSDVDGIEWMLEDARQAPLNIFLTLPSTIPATNASLETCGGDLTPAKAAALFDKWPEIVALERKWTSCQFAWVTPAHGVIAESLKRESQSVAIFMVENLWLLMPRAV